MEKKLKILACILCCCISFCVGMLVAHTILEDKFLELEDRVYILENKFVSVEEEEEQQEYNMSLAQDIYVPDRASVEAIARTLYGECRGVESTAEKAAVAWVILNRLDSGYGHTVVEVVSQAEQFLGYSPDHPLQEDLLYLSEDVMIRWNAEKEGVSKSISGRVIPEDYLWFRGDGDHNYFRNVFYTDKYWDWSLESPYEN